MNADEEREWHRFVNTNQGAGWVNADEEREWHRFVNTSLVPRMQDSAICVSLPPANPDEIDAKFAVELGVMIMLNKPILVVHLPGAVPIPPKLAQVADQIIYLETPLSSPESGDRIREGVDAMMARLEQGDEAQGKSS